MYKFLRIIFAVLPPRLLRRQMLPRGLFVVLAGDGSRQACHSSRKFSMPCIIALRLSASMMHSNGKPIASER